MTRCKKTLSAGSCWLAKAYAGIVKMGDLQGATPNKAIAAKLSRTNSLRPGDHSHDLVRE